MAEIPSNSNILISVDPASSKPSTCAVFSDGKLAFVFSIYRLEKDYLSFLDEISSKYNGILCVESQWYQRNVNTLILLVTARVEIETIFRLNGWKIFHIHPMKWQSFILNTTRKDKHAKRKQMSLENIKKQGIGYTKDDNVADAINIGLYALENISV